MAVYFIEFDDNKGGCFCVTPPFFMLPVVDKSIVCVFVLLTSGSYQTQLHIVIFRMFQSVIALKDVKREILWWRFPKFYIPAPARCYVMLCVQTSLTWQPFPSRRCGRSAFVSSRMKAVLLDRRPALLLSVHCRKLALCEIARNCDLVCSAIEVNCLRDCDVGNEALEPPRHLSLHRAVAGCAKLLWIAARMVENMTTQC